MQGLCGHSDEPAVERENVSPTAVAHALELRQPEPVSEVTEVRRRLVAVRPRLVNLPGCGEELWRRPVEDDGRHHRIGDIAAPAMAEVCVCVRYHAVAKM